jgi:tetratricopeptide (TPR) repeat protein
MKWARRRPVAAALAAVSSVAVLILIVAVFAVQQARVLEARAREQEALRRQQLVSLQAEAQELVYTGQSALTAENWQDARSAFREALVKIGSEPSLAELRKRAEDLLAAATSKLTHEANRRRERDNYREFLKLRDDALFHATLFTGRDLTSNLETTKQKARQALDLFQVKIDSHQGPTFGHLRDAQQQKEIRENCYELLLILAEAVAYPVAGQRPEERRRRLADALHILDRASSLGVATQAYHLYRAKYQSALGDERAAQEDRQRAEAVPSTSTLDCFLSGNEKFKTGELDQAIRDLERAVRLQPNHFWAEYFLGICYLKKHRPAEARASLNACLGLRSDFICTYLLRGFAHAELQEYRAAEEDYDKALHLNPADEDKYAIHVNRGVMRIRQGLLAEGMADLERAIESKPSQYQGYVNLAQGYEKRNEFAKAVEQINKAIERAPASTQATLYRIRAQLHKELQDSESALSDLKQATHAGGTQKTLYVFGASTAGLLGSALDQGPLLAASSLIPGRIPLQIADDHFERGRILQVGKRYSQAVLAYDEALRIRPDYADVHRLRGKALLELERYGEAIQSFDQYLARAELEVPTYLARAWAKTKLGQYSSAIEDYTLALKMKPESDTFAYRGWLHLLCDAPKLAQSDFEQAIGHDPKNAEAFNGLGYSRVVQGQYREGIRDANTALRLGPETTQLLYTAARTFAQAIAKMDRDPTRRNRQASEGRYACQARAFDLIRSALRGLPVTERSQFWRDVVQADHAIDPIRASSEWASLEVLYSKPRK